MPTIRRRVAATLALSMVTGLLAAAPVSAAVADDADVVIDEVYGGGGNTGASFNRDFVELHNQTGEPFDLAGYSVQHASATGNSWSVTTLSGSIPAGGQYLVGLASGGAPGAAITPDASGSSNLGVASGKVALVHSTTALTCSAACEDLAQVVDLVGWGGTATSFAGTAPATAPSGNVSSLTRDGDHTNTADNAADFGITSPPTPEGSGAEEPEPGDPEVVTIAEIQGTGAASPFDGAVVTTRGVVTAAYPTGGFNGYVLQTEGTGGESTLDGRTVSDAVFVFSPATVASVAVGDLVELTATVDEFNGLTELVNVTGLAVLDDPFDPVLPLAVAWPTTDAERERIESMLIAPAGDYTVSNSFTANRFSEVGLAAGTTPLVQPTDVVPADDVAGVAAVVAENAARRVVLDDAASTDFLASANQSQTPPYVSLDQPLRVGAAVTFPEPVVVDYRFDLWRFQPTHQVTAATPDGQRPEFANTRDAAPAAVGGDVRVASFNVLNYFTTLGADVAGCTSFDDRTGDPVTVSGGCDPRGAWDPADFERQQEKIVAAIETLDAHVVGLMEIENSAALGEAPDEAVASLVDALNAAAGTERWAYVPSSEELPDPSVQDVIGNALIYQPAVVDLVGDPRALGTESGPGGAFVNAREPIGQAFVAAAGGEPFFVAVNHLKSKSATGASGADADQGDGQGAFNASRVAQAEALLAWTDGVLDETGIEDAFLLGDFNAYTQEDPLQVLYEAGYEDVNLAVGGNVEQSYSFDGLNGSLDHVLANAGAAERVTGSDIWTINAPEAISLEYSRFNYHGTLFHDPGPFRSSDHDPVLVGVAAGEAPAGEVRITEWMYDGAGGEFVELTNVGDGAVDLTGWTYDDDSADPAVGFDLSGIGTLDPGESAVFVEATPTSFRADWGLCAAATVVGPYTNNLGRADVIHVFDADDVLVDRLAYGDQTIGGPRTTGRSAWVQEAGLGADDPHLWTLSTAGDTEGSWTSSGGAIGSPAVSTHGGVDPCPEEPPSTVTIELDDEILSGSIGDAANPGTALTVADSDGPVADVEVTVASSNEGVLPAADVTITGDGAERAVAFDPAGRGVTTLTFTATDADGDTAEATLTYGASNEVPDPSGAYHHGISDASAALDVGDGYVLLLNDETNTIFLHDLDTTGRPAKTWTFTPAQLGTDDEVDFEGIARTGDTVVMVGSHGNNREGEVREERRTLVAATITGSGADTELAFLGRYDGLRDDLLAWDAANGDALGLADAAAPGVLPNPPGGFNIEAAEFAPDGETLYLGLRAPTVGDDDEAVIVPVTDVESLFDGSGPATFDDAILVDLDGRSIRSIASNDQGDYLISAGASPRNPTWALYTWDGDADRAPLFNVGLPAEDPLTGGPWEAIATVPHPLAEGAVVRLVTDSGDTDFYGTGATKDLAPGFQKSYSQDVALAQPPEVDLTLLGINDFHGRIDSNTVNFAGTIEELRALAGGEQSSLLVGAGDLIGASLFASAVAQDQPTIDVLNALGLDVSAVGNHEFDQGFADLTDRVIGDPDPNALWAYLGANVYLDGTTTPALPEYALFERAGLTIGVIGAVTEETPTLVSPAGVAMLDFGDPVDAVNRVAAQLSDGDPANGEADVLVATYHEGGAGDGTIEDEIAEGGVFAGLVLDTSPLVDAIFTGHTHRQYVYAGPVPGEPGRTRPIVQTGNYGEFVGEIVLTVDTGTFEVLAHTERNVARTTTPAATLVATYPRVAEVEVIVDLALDNAADVGNEPVGSVTADITTAFLGGARDDRASESTLGNLVADSLLATLSDPARGGAEIGVVNPGGLRADLLFAPDGVVTYAEANAVLPFVNNLWTTTLTGAQFETLLEQQWQRDPAGNVPSRSYLQLGLSENVRYTYDPALPEGSRITSITVDGEPIDPAGEYRIGTFSFLVEGGDNFHVFKDGTGAADSGLVDREAWIAYIGGASPLSPDFARRSTVVTGLVPVPAGGTLAFGVSKLDLTSLGSPANTSVEVLLDGTSLGTAPVAAGAASISVGIPAGTSVGEHELTVVASPTGTTITRSIDVTALEPGVVCGSANECLVRAAYLRFLGREPDPAGLAAWSAQLASGRPAATVLGAIAGSNEARGRWLDQLYQAALGRPADAVGRSAWLAQLAAGAGEYAVVSGVVSSAEFRSKAGGTDAGVVARLYQVLLGRAPDAAGAAGWTAALSSGQLSVGALARSLRSSSERTRRTVSALYLDLLGRPADAAGLAGWASYLAGGADDQAAAVAFLASPEGRARNTP